MERANSRRSGRRSIAITRAAPSMNALAIANCPTGPQPQTATASFFLDLGIPGSHVPSRKKVRKEKHFFIRKVVLDFDWADIREGHTNVLRVTTGIPAHHVGVAKQTRTGISIGRFHQVGVRIGIVAGGPDLLLTKLAIPACD